MSAQLRQSILIASFMLAAGIAVLALRQEMRTENTAPPIDLKSIVPRQFGQWHVDDALLPLVVSPDVQQKLDMVYDQMLTRTYVDDHGERVILLLAYGRMQLGGDLQLHRPEGCYAAQGFLFEQMKRDSVALDGRIIPVTRLVAVKGNRIEHITYWARVGDKLVRGYFNQALVRISIGLKGRHSDGLLFRVSNLDRDTQHSMDVQDRFIRDLMSAVPADKHSVLIGK